MQGGAQGGLPSRLCVRATGMGERRPPFLHAHAPPTRHVSTSLTFSLPPTPSITPHLSTQHPDPPTIADPSPTLPPVLPHPHATTPPLQLHPFIPSTTLAPTFRPAAPAAPHARRRPQCEARSCTACPTGCVRSCMGGYSSARPPTASPSSVRRLDQPCIAACRPRTRRCPSPLCRHAQ